MSRNRLLVLATAGVVVVALAAVYFLGTVLLTLGISAVIAYVMLPVARLLERGMPWRHRRPDLSRGIAIGIIFLVALAVLAGILAAVIPPTIEQSREFIEDFPAFFREARETVEGWIARYEHLIPPEARDLAEEALAGAGSILAGAAKTLISRTWGVVSGSFALFLGIATAPVLIFYMMKDSGQVKSSLCAPFPAGVRRHLQEILDIADRTVGAYIRGQLTLGLIVGVFVTVGLLLIGVPFAFILGIVAGLTELIPIIGPWIGGAAGVLVTLATAPDKVLWVILLYLVVQLLENTLLVPRVQGNTLKLHPIAVIMVITIGSQYFGLWGVILGPPLVAMGRGIIVYLVNEWQSPSTPGGPEADGLGVEDAEPAVTAGEEG